MFFFFLESAALIFVLIPFSLNETTLFQPHFERIQIVSPANEVYKCVNWTQNVNTQLVFFAFAVVIAKGVSDIQHWLRCYIIACPYGSIPTMPTEFQSEKCKSKYLFFFFPPSFFLPPDSLWFRDVFLCVKITL